jgi:hypothetical protein
MIHYARRLAHLCRQLSSIAEALADALQRRQQLAAAYDRAPAPVDVLIPARDQRQLDQQLASIDHDYRRALAQLSSHHAARRADLDHDYAAHVAQLYQDAAAAHHIARSAYEHHRAE